MIGHCRLIIVAVAAVLAGGFAAVLFVERVSADNTALSHSRYAEAHLAVLEHLRKGDTAKAMRDLETLLDGDIQSLYPSQSISAQTSRVAAEAIWKAQDYRSRYPRHTQRRSTEGGITRVPGMYAN